MLVASKSDEDRSLITDQFLRSIRTFTLDCGCPTASAKILIVKVRSMKSKSEKAGFVQPRNPNGILESPQVPATPVASDATVAPVPSGVESSPPFSKPKRARNGKVARLPKQMRDQINQMLDDNLHYHSIIKSLGDQGKDLETDHIRRWKSGGYRDYLREQRLIEQCRRTSRARLQSPLR